MDYDHYTGSAIFKVSDTGIGISENDKPKLFTMFARVGSGEQKRANNTKGVGLGLTICKRLVEQMGGFIDFESEIGKGSCFLFEIPVTLPQNTY